MLFCLLCWAFPLYCQQLTHMICAPLNLFTLFIILQPSVSPSSSPTASPSQSPTKAVSAVSFWCLTLCISVDIIRSLIDLFNTRLLLQPSSSPSQSPTPNPTSSPTPPFPTDSPSTSSAPSSMPSQSSAPSDSPSDSPSTPFPTVSPSTSSVPATRLSIVSTTASSADFSRPRACARSGSFHTAESSSSALTSSKRSCLRA